MQVNSLSFSYGNQKILDGISFALPEGKITTILGCNGSGKTTLFSLLARFLTPQSGEILLDGKSVRDYKPKEFAKRVAIVNQVNTFEGEITVKKLVAFGRTPFLKPMQSPGKVDQEAIDWALGATGIQKLSDARVSKLSGGQMQRVWIAMALAQKTRYLLLDEPTTYLDIRYQYEILELVQKINWEHHITIFMVLHDINQAMEYSDHILGLKQGRLIAQGAPKKVMTGELIDQLYGIPMDICSIKGKRIAVKT